MIKSTKKKENIDLIENYKNELIQNEKNRIQRSKNFVHYFCNLIKLQSQNFEEYSQKKMPKNYLLNYLTREEIKDFLKNKAFQSILSDTDSRIEKNLIYFHYAIELIIFLKKAKLKEISYSILDQLKKDPKYCDHLKVQTAGLYKGNEILEMEPSKIIRIHKNICFAREFFEPFKEFIESNLLKILKFLNNLFFNN